MGEARSPVATIASPKMIRGLSIPKKEAQAAKNGLGEPIAFNNTAEKSFDFRIKNHKPGSTRTLYSR